MNYVYQGGELELFAEAVNWKRHFARSISEFIGGRVLEVGAGLGANIPYLYNRSVTEWTSLEPDLRMCQTLKQSIDAARMHRICHIRHGTVATIDGKAQFDSILYIDVLEHIEDDRAELERAAALLSRRGYLIVVSPAHQFLFSPFDAEVGHFRRYSRNQLIALAPSSLALRRIRLLDSVGFFASLANRAVLRSGNPTVGQVRFWNRFLVPISRIGDPVLRYRFGKTVVAAWQKC